MNEHMGIDKDEIKRIDEKHSMSASPTQKKYVHWLFTEKESGNYKSNLKSELQKGIRRKIEEMEKEGIEVSKDYTPTDPAIMAESVADILYQYHINPVTKDSDDIHGEDLIAKIAMDNAKKTPGNYGLKAEEAKVVLGYLKSRNLLEEKKGRVKTISVLKKVMDSSWDGKLETEDGPFEEKVTDTERIIEDLETIVSSQNKEVIKEHLDNNYKIEEKMPYASANGHEKETRKQSKIMKWILWGSLVASVATAAYVERKAISRHISQYLNDFTNCVDCIGKKFREYGR